MIPVFCVAGIYARWGLSARTVLYAASRMVLQLIAIGFVLIPLFKSGSWLLHCAILTAMLAAAGWIAIRPVDGPRGPLFTRSFFSLAAGGLTTLILVSGAILQVTPWGQPRYVIPIAGMIFANAMNSVSLAAERFQSERRREASFAEARRTAFQAALLPVINTFFAVGLVSLPGMMTGQILAGISPLIAVRYQILVMCMVFGAGGLSAAAYLSTQRE